MFGSPVGGPSPYGGGQPTLGYPGVQQPGMMMPGASPGMMMQPGGMPMDGGMMGVHPGGPGGGMLLGPGGAGGGMMDPGLMMGGGLPGGGMDGMYGGGMLGGGMGGMPAEQQARYFYTAAYCGEPDFEGMLMIQDTFNKLMWKAREAVIKDNVLFLFKPGARATLNRRYPRPGGHARNILRTYTQSQCKCINLEYAEVQIAESATGRPCSFSLYHKNPYAAHKWYFGYFLACNDYNELNVWLEQIKKCKISRAKEQLQRAELKLSSGVAEALQRHAASEEERRKQLAAVLAAERNYSKAVEKEIEELENAIDDKHAQDLAGKAQLEAEAEEEARRVQQQMLSLPAPGPARRRVRHARRLRRRAPGLGRGGHLEPDPGVRGRRGRREHHRGGHRPRQRPDRPAPPEGGPGARARGQLHHGDERRAAAPGRGHAAPRAVPQGGERARGELIDRMKSGRGLQV